MMASHQAVRISATHLNVIKWLSVLHILQEAHGQILILHLCMQGIPYFKCKRC